MFIGCVKYNGFSVFSRENAKSLCVSSLKREIVCYRPQRGKEDKQKWGHVLVGLGEIVLQSFIVTLSTFIKH
jgi:hypothetical protein